ncbi:helix-turn-helix domain-containing protein [Lactococcus lactis]|uniref:helix-turn-helix domain-containing protein n=1 Tax=Lactococcus lactis TaxID=1358 RepID=UPI00050D8B29|nr:helix-turn-helix transcriptional regulator [Lactococcus lactis]AIS03132.1 Transcriptional regulator, Cro/CI family [Lactococcus lactis]
MLYERLQELIKKSNKSMNQIERELGYPRNTISSYKRQNPSTKRLNELAEYFDVSVDYLLGRQDEPKYKEDLSEEESELIGAFRMEREDMTPDEQVKFNEAVKDLMKYAKERLNDDSIWKK